MKVSRILKATGGKLLSGDRNADIDLSKVSTDSRSIKREEFFIALSGPNFCGSLFLEDALKKGASGAIVEDCAIGQVDRDKILISVKDAVKAMQDIASAHRAQFNIPVIAVTGSNGKTTVKEMIATVLSSKYSVLKNEGTKNNHVGVPQTLLKLNASHRMCVLEFGTNHKGEIETLTKIARPTMAVITNIGPSHLEHLIDLDGVYREKKSVLDTMGRDGIAVVNGDDPYLRKIKRGKFKVLRYGLDESNDMRASDIRNASGRLEFNVNGKDEYSLKLLGVHNVQNALAAIAVAYSFGISRSACRKALLKFKPSSMRLNTLTVNGLSVINDSYNSNPASMRTALDAMRTCRVNARWVASGDMLELGKHARQLHRSAGRLAAESGVSGLMAFGKFSRDTLSGAREGGIPKNRLWYCSSHNQIADIIRKVAGAGDAVLIKGSRGMRMEKVIEILKG